MLGINYRYEFNDKKNTIKLAPTKGVLITSLVICTIPYVVLAGLIVLEKYEDSKRPKTTHTEDLNPEDLD